MSNFENQGLTAAGLLMSTGALAGDDITFTKIVMGDGILTNTDAQAQMNNLINPLVTLDIVKIEQVNDTQVVVQAIFNNNDLTEGFYFREMGLFAANGNSVEYMYAYGNAGSYAEFIPAGNSGNPVEKLLKITTIVFPSASVSALINSAACATVADYEYYKSIALNAQTTSITALNTANTAKANASSAQSESATARTVAEAAENRVQALWDAFQSDIVSNPWQITFKNLSDCNPISGCWNTERHRLEC